MLILTTNALVAGSGNGSLPAWPGVPVLVVLPGSGLSRGEIEALNETFIVIEWLEPPAGTAAILHDVAVLLADRLRREDGPLLFLDRPEDAGAGRIDPLRLPLQAVRADHGADGKLVRLALGEMVATSPLLPEFFRAIGRRTIDDALLVELLNETFAWGDA